MIARAVPGWAIAVTGLVVGALLAGGVTLAVKDAELADLQREHAARQASADRDALARLQAAAAHADQLTLDLHAQVSANAALQEQIDEQLALATLGRPCLDPAALRLLDRAAQPPAAVPAPARRAAAARAPQPAADPAQPARPAAAEPAATDTDVARWANDAYHRYADCAARLDALIRWHDDPAVLEPAP